MSDSATTPGKPKKVRSCGWRIFFTIFKWTRVAILLALLCAIILVLFLNRVGLPGWVERRIVAQMNARGWDMQFSWLRLHWYRGIVASHLQLSRTNTMAGPNLFVETAEFRLNERALRSFDLQADSVRLDGARLMWPLPGTNLPRQTFVLNQVRGELLFSDNDHWELRSLQAECLGAIVRIRGDVSHASLLRDWKLPQRKPRAPGEREGDFWRDFLTQADKVRAIVPPAVTVLFALDAGDLRSLDASARITAPGVRSPWGSATNLVLTARVFPAVQSNDTVQTEIKLAAQYPRTPWGIASNLLLTARLEPSLTELFPTNGTLKLEVVEPRTPWGAAGFLALDMRTAPRAADPAARLTTLTIGLERPVTTNGAARSAIATLRISHDATNLLPASFQGDAVLDQPATRWATSDWARAEATIVLPRGEDLFWSRTNLSLSDRLKSTPLDLTVWFSNAHAPKFEANYLSLTNHWSWPEWRVAAGAQIPAGSVAAQTTLNAETRAATVHAALGVDPHLLEKFLPTNVRPWLAEYQSDGLFNAQVDGRATLPKWTNDAAAWRSAFLPTLSATGSVETGAATFRKVHFETAHLLASYSNLLWTLPEIRFSRSEGIVDAEGEVDPQSGAFRLKLRSMIDPQALRPAFSDGDQEDVFDPFEFTVLPVLAGEVRGNFRDFSTISARAAGAVTNVTYKKQFFRYATATADYTNGFISIYRVLVLRDGEQGAADGIGIDVPGERMYLTNAHGNLAPMVVARAIGPNVVRAIKPYVFDVPPMVRADGFIPLGAGDRSEDLHFEITGGTFHWWRIQADNVRASIHWLGEDLLITNVQARWRGANASGWAQFDFRQPKGGGMAFHLMVDDGDLGRIVQDLQGGRTNRLEGVTDLDLTVTKAFANDIASWNGFGRASLTNGLLWDIPLFGMASTLLNGINPGLGRSRAKSATATFTLTNSVIHSQDVVIEASAMHLKYRGAVDFDGNVDARMDAQLLAGVPGIGSFFGVVLWPVTKLFEYRVTRTLDNPKLEEVYFIPKLLLMPFQPIKTLRNIFGRDDDKPPEAPADRPPRKSPKATP